MRSCFCSAPGSTERVIGVRGGGWKGEAVRTGVKTGELEEVTVEEAVAEAGFEEALRDLRDGLGSSVSVSRR